MATMSPMWFILLEITCFFVAHAYEEDMSLRTLSGVTHEEAILGLKASITRRNSITSTPPSYSPSPPLPPQDLKKPHVYPLTSYGADPTGNSDSTEALAAKGPSEGFLMKDIKDLGGAQVHLEGGKYLISKPLQFSTARGWKLHANVVKGMNSKATVAKMSMQGNGTSWTVDFSKLLLFPNLTKHVVYTLIVNGSTFPNHALRNVSQSRCD